MTNSPPEPAIEVVNVPEPVVHPRPARWWLWKLLPVGLFLAAGLVLILLLGVAQRVGWLKQAGGTAGASATTAGAGQIFTCPMHPQIRQPGPGRCPICGMELVPATAAGDNLDEWAVNIAPAQRRLANIQTAEVQSGPVSTAVETIGAIQIDESRQATIAAYVSGRIERLFADYTGVEVARGDHLAVVYSPELYGAQVEYVEARKALAKMTTSTLASVRVVQKKLVENSRQKLVELGMTDEQLANLESSETAQARLTIYAPIGGTVTEKLAEEGKYIDAGEPIYRIANLSTVWLMLELYPEDAARIRFGQRVEAEMQSLPGETLTGRVAFIAPTVDPQQRTVGVRVEFKNERGLLRPGDYARASITVPIGPQGRVYDEQLAGKWISPMHPQVIRDEPGDCPICGMKLVPTSRYGYSDTPVAQPDSLFVPRSAVLMAGEHSVVYVETDPGRFELRTVTLGPILRNRAVILAGVEEGEKVATSGNFLIDSQMQLAGKPSLIDPTRATGGAPPSRNTPLEFESLNPLAVTGPAGEKLEGMFQAYFRVQQAFAADRVPAEQDAAQLHRLAGELAAADELSPTVQAQMKTIAQNSQHLHHLKLDDARKAFKPISHAVVALATEVRGGGAEPVYHFFCPMVPEGGGDWLQGNDQLVNPYFGSQMLKCGELVHTIAPAAPDQPAGGSPAHDHPPTSNERDGE